MGEAATILRVLARRAIEQAQATYRASLTSCRLILCAVIISVATLGARSDRTC
jgi:hypothetical protein